MDLREKVGFFDKFKEIEKKRQEIEWEKREEKEFGSINPVMICPHCQTKGFVSTIQVKRKAGISGGKVMGGLMTVGASLLVTGLSRKQQVTQAHCGNCNSTWDF